MNRPNINSYFTKRLEQFDQSWVRHTLPNGMLAVHVPNLSEDSFYLETMIKTGARHETANTAGLSHFLEHMMFRGTKRLPHFTDLAEEFEWLGGEWNAATGYEHTEYSYDGIANSAPQVIELFNEFMDSPSLNDLEIEREIILREIEGDLNEFGHSTDLDLHLSKLLWPDSSLALPILGDPDTLETLSQKDLVNKRQTYYSPTNMCVLTVGGDTDATLKRIESTFGKYRIDDQGSGIATFDPPKPYKGPLFNWVEDSDNEYSIVISFAIDGEWSKKDCAYEVLTRILSDGFCSRLSSHLREKLGLVYSVDADATRITEAGTLEIAADVHISKINDYLRETLKILRELKTNGPTANEFERSLLRSIVDLELTPSHPDSIGARVCWSHLSQKNFNLLDYRQGFQSLKLDDMKNLCDDIFRKEKFALVIMGPKREGLIDDLKAITEKEL
jgi:predicted Zn-dependent peptidase